MDDSSSTPVLVTSVLVMIIHTMTNHSHWGAAFVMADVLVKEFQKLVLVENVK